MFSVKNQSTSIVLILLVALVAVSCQTTGVSPDGDASPVDAGAVSDSDEDKQEIGYRCARPGDDDTEYYAVSGRIIDSQGDPVPDVAVAIDPGAKVSTDANGEYVIDCLQAGAYNIRPMLDGTVFSPNDVKVVLPEDAAAHFDFVGEYCAESQNWYAEYYGNRELQGAPDMTRCDADIDFYWSVGPPYADGPTDDFSVRWTRTIDIEQPGWRRFRAFTDDGVALYVDGEIVFDELQAPRCDGKETEQGSLCGFGESWGLKELAAGRHKIEMRYAEWVGDAMAHLTWYQCPNGRDDCAMDITPRYQTSYPGDRMPLGCEDASYTVKRYGCLITALAMALEAYGFPTTPRALNEWLSHNGGYIGGYSGCDANLVSVDKVADYVRETHGVQLYFKGVNSIDAAKASIRDAKPVLMGIGRPHFFLAVDVAEQDGYGTLGINDPLHVYYPIVGGSLNHNTTLRDTNYVVANTIATIDSTPPAQPSSIQFNIRGTEVLLADSLGRRVGVDPASRAVLREIPDAMYFDSKIVPPGDVPDGEIERVLRVVAGPDYRANLQIIGPTPPSSAEPDGAPYPFEILIVGSDGQGNYAEAELSGEITGGETIQYAVSYRPEREVLEVQQMKGDAGSSRWRR